MVKRLGAATVLLLCLTVILPAATPAVGNPLRAEVIMHGLDYLHGRQRAGGGFDYGSAVSDPVQTPWVILAISAAKEAPTRWDYAKDDPIEFLQSQDLVKIATASPDEVYAPVFYAQCIMAYAASGRPISIYNAGSGDVDLVAKLNGYRSPVDDSYSPGGGKLSVTTTSWAILALSAADEEFAGWRDSVAWLKGKSEPGGGFARQPGDAATVEATSAAILALRAGGVAKDDPVIVGALDYLAARQRDSAGFERAAGDTHGYAEPTAWAMQALCSCDIDPESWQKGTDGATPQSFLRWLQTSEGRFNTSAGNRGTNPLRTTAVALVGRCAAQDRHLPYDGLASKPYTPLWRPGLLSFVPHGGESFHTGTVTVSATYRDNPGGTGIKASAVSISVDGTSKTGPATITSSKLTLKLVGLANGSHAVSIRLEDRAGNSQISTHTFAVRAPSPRPTPSMTPTIIRPTPTQTPTTVVTPTATLEPTPSIAPTILSPSPEQPTPYSSSSPTPDDSGYPWPSGSPSPSASGSAVPAGTSGGGGWGPTALGAVLVSLVPIGALVSYFARRRASAKLDGASHGKMLPGGGSAWQRLRGRFGRHSQSSPAAADK